MNFLIKNKKLVNLFFVISEVVDATYNIVINILSQDKFNMFSKHNITTGVIFVVLLVIHILCKIAIKNSTASGQKHHLQKVFKESGGYEVVVKKMMTCIENDDYKRIRDLKKIVNYIEE